MAGIFKRYYAPNGMAINDSNCIFVCPLGSDSNTGSRTSPYQTVTKAFSVWIGGGRPYLCTRGKSTENPTLTIATNPTVISYYMFGDDDSAHINGLLTFVNNTWSPVVTLSDLRIDNLYFNSNRVNYASNLIVTGYLYANALLTSLYKCMISELRSCYCTNNQYELTVKGFKNYSVATYGASIIVRDTIFTDYIDLYPYTSVYTVIHSFQYCLIRKSTLWQWKGTTIPITYTAATGVLETDSTQWKTDIYNSLTTYYNSLSASSAKTYLALLLANWSTILTGTSKIVDDINYNQIFNKYQDGNPVDYSLKLVTGNPALYMSSSDAYVGMYPPAIFGTPGAITDVDSNGSDTANTPDLLVMGMNNVMYASSASTQYRNRIKFTQVDYPRGYAFNGMVCDIKSGIAARYCWGKVQPYTATSIPQESAEMTPVNADGSASSFPRFSVKLNGNTQMWYHTQGAKIGQPVLFNDLSTYFAITTDNSLTEYGTWAVTTADYESYLLSSKSGCQLQNIMLYHFIPELNLNYYD